MSIPAIIKIKIRTGTLAEWVNVNPILLEAEFGFISDDKRVIIGNGINAFLDLIDSFHWQNQIANYQDVQNLSGSFLSALGDEITDRIDADGILQDNIDNIVFDVTTINGTLTSFETRISAVETTLLAVDLTLTAKGQILVLDDIAGKYIPLQVGANGYILTADDTNSSGISWSAIPNQSIALEDLTDVNINPLTIAQGDLIQYNAINGEWINSPTPTIPNALDDLTDVNLGTLNNGDVLTYDSSVSEWTNASVPRNIDDLGDVAIISPATNDVLKYSGGSWSNSPESTFTSPLTTKGDIYVRNSSADTRLPIGLNTQVLSADSSQATGLKWISNSAPVPLGYYGQFFSYVSQSATTNNVGKAMAFETLDLSNGISVVTDGSALTKITFANTGKYNLQFSTQFQNTDNAHQDVYIWLRKNGTTSASDVVGSTGLVSIPARKSAGAGNEGHSIVSWNFLLDIVAGDYYQIVWSTSDIANVTIHFYASSVNHPSTASTLFTITQLAGILAGTGVTAINGLSNASQTFASNGSGTDFNIASTGNTHTFNLPSASATNRGALTSADFNTFNGKQNLLVSGTNIKTINSNSLLGSGNISVGTITFVTGTSPIISSGGNTPAISIQQANASQDGYLSSADFNTFNNKLTSFFQYRKSGRWYNNGLFPAANAGFTNVLNTIRFVPFFIDADVTITRLGLNVLTSAPASSSCRLGIYTNDANTCQPLNRLVDSGIIDLVTTGAKSVTGLSVALTKGLYWLAYISNSSSGTITGLGTNFIFDVKGQSAIGGVGFAGFNQTLTYGALPSSAGTLIETNSTGTICINYYY